MLENQDIRNIPIKYEYGEKTRIKMEHDLLDEWKVSIGKCEDCGRTEMLTLDHIIPLIILRDFGFNPKKFFDKENLRLICRPCNGIKSGRLDFSDPRTKKLLLKYLEMI